MGPSKIKGLQHEDHEAHEDPFSGRSSTRDLPKRAFVVFAAFVVKAF
jgi:hypothetical protein